MAKTITHLRECASKTGLLEEQTSYRLDVRRSLKGPTWIQVTHREICSLCAESIVLHDYTTHANALVASHRAQTSVWLATWAHRAKLWEEEPF